MASQLESFSKWLQLKIYQLEVTMSVYIYTPIEKFIFCASSPRCFQRRSLPEAKQELTL